MSVLLDKPLKRELAIGKDHYTLTITPAGLKLVPKGRRNGVELAWQDLVSGQAALAVALNASLEHVSTFDRRPAARPKGAGAPAARGRTSRP